MELYAIGCRASHGHWLIFLVILFTFCFNAICFTCNFRTVYLLVTELRTKHVCWQPQVYVSADAGIWHLLLPDLYVLFLPTATDDVDGR